MYIVNYEKIICDKKSDMTSVNSEKILDYLKVQESLRSRNLTEFYLYEGVFYMFFCTLNDILQAQSKVNH